MIIKVLLLLVVITELFSEIKSHDYSSYKSHYANLHKISKNTDDGIQKDKHISIRMRTPKHIRHYSHPKYIAKYEDPEDESKNQRSDRYDYTHHYNDKISAKYGKQEHYYKYKEKNPIEDRQFFNDGNRHLFREDNKNFFKHEVDNRFNHKPTESEEEEYESEEEDEESEPEQPKKMTKMEEKRPVTFNSNQNYAPEEEQYKYYEEKPSKPKMIREQQPKHIKYQNQEYYGEHQFPFLEEKPQSLKQIQIESEKRPEEYRFWHQGIEQQPYKYDEENEESPKQIKEEEMKRPDNYKHKQYYFNGDQQFWLNDEIHSIPKKTNKKEEKQQMDHKPKQQNTFGPQHFHPHGEREYPKNVETENKRPYDPKIKHYYESEDYQPKLNEMYVKQIEMSKEERRPQIHSMDEIMKPKMKSTRGERKRPVTNTKHNFEEEYLPKPMEQKQQPVMNLNKEPPSMPKKPTEHEINENVEYQHYPFKFGEHNQEIKKPNSIKEKKPSEEEYKFPEEISQDGNKFPWTSPDVLDFNNFYKQDPNLLGISYPTLSNFEQFFNQKPQEEKHTLPNFNFNYDDKTYQQFNQGEAEKEAIKYYPEAGWTFQLPEELKQNSDEKKQEMKKPSEQQWQFQFQEEQKEEKKKPVKMQRGEAAPYWHVLLQEQQRQENNMPEMKKPKPEMKKQMRPMEHQWHFQDQEELKQENTKMSETKEKTNTKQEWPFPMPEEFRQQSKQEVKKRPEMNEEMKPQRQPSKSTNQNIENSKMRTPMKPQTEQQMDQKNNAMEIPKSKNLMQYGVEIKHPQPEKEGFRIIVENSTYPEHDESEQNYEAPNFPQFHFQNEQPDYHQKHHHSPNLQLQFEHQSLYLSAPKHHGDPDSDFFNIHHPSQIHSHPQRNEKLQGELEHNLKEIKVEKSALKLSRPAQRSMDGVEDNKQESAVPVINFEDMEYEPKNENITKGPYKLIFPTPA